MPWDACRNEADKPNSLYVSTSGESPSCPGFVGRHNVGPMPHLEQQAIPRAAISNCTDHFSLVNTPWESEINSACSIEAFQLFGGEFQIETGEIVLELRYLPRSNDRDYWRRLMEQPGECNLRHAATGLFGNRLYSRYHRRRALFPLRIECFHSLIGHPPAVGLAFAVIFPAFGHALRSHD